VIARFPRDWTLAFVVGELVGFAPPALVGAWLGAAEAGDIALVAGLTLAGVAEGAAIGSAQAFVLRRHRSGIPTGPWIGATAAGAAIAWFAGMGGAAVMGAGAPTWTLVLLVPAWITGLAAMGFLQWRVMRSAVPRSGRWVVVSSAAWLAGVLIPVAAISLVPDGWPVAGQVVIAILSAVLMGLVVGALTGLTMARLLRRAQGAAGPQTTP
jgi:hypothetical protein